MDSAMARQRALITGITGMVGSHLADFLIENTDWDIYGLCRWRSPLDNLAAQIPRINRGDRMTLLYGDLRDTLSLRDAVVKSKPDYVFHLAAQSFPRTSFDAPLDTLDTNVQGTARLLDALRSHKKDALIHVCSSSEVFGQELLGLGEEVHAVLRSGEAVALVGVFDVLDLFAGLLHGLDHLA